MRANAQPVTRTLIQAEGLVCPTALPAASVVRLSTRTATSAADWPTCPKCGKQEWRREVRMESFTEVSVLDLETGNWVCLTRDPEPTQKDIMCGNCGTYTAEMDGGEHEAFDAIRLEYAVEPSDQSRQVLYSF